MLVDEATSAVESDLLGPLEVGAPATQAVARVGPVTGYLADASHRPHRPDRLVLPAELVHISGAGEDEILLARHYPGRVVQHPRVMRVPVQHSHRVVVLALQMRPDVRDAGHALVAGLHSAGAGEALALTDGLCVVLYCLGRGRVSGGLPPSYHLVSGERDGLVGRGRG